MGKKKKEGRFTFMEDKFACPSADCGASEIFRDNSFHHRVFGPLYICYVCTRGFFLPNGVHRKLVSKKTMADLDEHIEKLHQERLVLDSESQV